MERVVNNGHCNVFNALVVCASLHVLLFRDHSQIFQHFPLHMNRIVREGVNIYPLFMKIMSSTHYRLPGESLQRLESLC